jgi:hypothetical protein
MKNLRKWGFALMFLCILTNVSVNAQKCHSSIKEDNFGIIHGDMNNNFFINNPCGFHGGAFINVYSSIKRPEVTILNNNGMSYAPIINSPIDSLIGQIMIPTFMPYNQPYFFHNMVKIVDLDNPLSICEIPFTVSNSGCGAVNNIRTHSQVCPERNGKISFEVSGMPGTLELLTSNNVVVFSKEYTGGEFKLDTIKGLKNQVYQLRFKELYNGVPLIYGYYNPNSNTLDFNLLVDISKPSTIEITGKEAVCVGNTTNLIPSVAGGVWSSSSNTKATVTNGILKGIAAGTAIISYSLGKDECLTSGSKPVTIESLPAPSITGPSKICWNGKAMFRSSVAGGVWAPINSALLLSSSQGLFRNGTQPSVDNFKSGVSYTLTSKLGSCVTKVVKNVYIRNVISPSVVVSSPKTTIKLNEVVTATSTTTNPANGTWSSTNTLISVTANTSNTKTASVKGLRVGSGSNVVYFADDAATGCRFSNWLGFNVLAAQSLVTATTDATSTIGVNVYPNPSNGNITLENISGANTISLVDMTGRTIKTVSVNAERMTVNFAGVQAGKYLVQITGEQMNETRTIVIE